MTDSDLAGVRTISAYKTLAVATGLHFPEQNWRKMVSTFSATITMVQPTRFVERSRHWTGRGIQAPPKLTGTRGDEELRVRRHGPLYVNDRREAFLIDLGRVIDAGETVNFTVESQFIDEYGEFETFQSFTADATVNHLDLGVSFVNPPLSCAYTFTDADGSPAETHDAESEVLGHSKRFFIHREPPLPGVHRLNWTPVAATTLERRPHT